jgi:hypothetical protein
MSPEMYGKLGRIREGDLLMPIPSKSETEDVTTSFL